jgi:protoporphyrinogen oxidase
MDSRSDVVVLGAGPAGLAAALRAVRSGGSVTLVEAGDQVGGLCRTMRSEGCRYDLGGHIPFLRSDDRVRWAEDLLGTDLIWVDRPVARVEDGRIRPGRYIDQQPHRVDDAVMPDGTAAGELGATVGAAFRDRVVRPYMEKVDGWTLEVIAADRAVKLRDEQRAPDGFWFPPGGIGSLMDAMEQAIRDAGGDVRLGTPMTSLRHAGGRVTGVEVGGGNPGFIEAGSVISAVTPGLVVRAADPAAPEGLLPDITMRAVALVYLVADRDPVGEEAWIQVSDPRVPFSRIAEFVNWDPGMVPAGRTVLCAEVYGSGAHDDPWWSLDDHGLARAVAGAMADPLGWVDDPSAFRMLRVVRLPRAYPLVEAWRVRDAMQAPLWLSSLEGLELARGGTVVTAIEAGESAADRAGGAVMAGAA